MFAHTSNGCDHNQVLEWLKLLQNQSSMTGTYVLLALTILAQTQALGSDFTPKSTRQQISNAAVNNIKVFTLLPAIVSAVALPSLASAAGDKKSFEYQPALAGLDYGKPRTYYPDFVQKTSGLQYKVVKEGSISIAISSNPFIASLYNESHSIVNEAEFVINDP